MPPGSMRTGLMGTQAGQTPCIGPSGRNSPPISTRLGFHSFWTAEAYGSDALTPLAWWGSRTERIGLGTGIIQISARTPATVGMAAIWQAWPNWPPADGTRPSCGGAAARPSPP